MNRYLHFVLSCGLFLAACLPAAEPIPSPPPATPHSSPAPTHTAVSTTTPTTTTVPTLTTPTTMAVSQPTPQPLFTAGEPHRLGRGEMVDAAFTPDGSAVAVGWANGVSFTTVPDAAEQWWLPVDVPLIAIDMHPQGTAVAAALGDGSILVIDAVTGDARSFAGAHPNAYLGDIAWSPDGTQIAFQFIGPRRGDPIYLLDPADGAVAEVPRSRIEQGTRPYLVWSPEGTWLILPVPGERCTRLVDVATGERPFTFTHAGGCYDPWAAVWSPDGSALALSGPQGIDLLDPQTGTQLAGLEGSALGFFPQQTGHPLAFSADGRYLISRGGRTFYNEVYPFIAWDMASGKQVVQVDEVDGVWDGGLRLAVTATGDGFVSLKRDGRLTRIAPGENSEETIGRLPVVLPHLSFVWSADGRKIGSENRYGGTLVLDAASGNLDLLAAAGQGNPALSADGRFAAVHIVETFAIVIVDIDSGAEISRLPTATGIPHGGAFSPTAVASPTPTATR